MDGIQSGGLRICGHFVFSRLLFHGPVQPEAGKRIGYRIKSLLRFHGRFAFPEAGVNKDMKAPFLAGGEARLIPKET
jgi:hypothetical protein